MPPPQKPSQPREPSSPPEPSANPGEPGVEKPGASKPSPNAMVLAGAGMELAAAVAVFSLGGWWLDEKLGTSPAFILVGLFIGLIGGMYNLYKVAKRFF